MTLQPEQQSTIFERIKSAIASASSLTAFTTNSPERAITDDGFSAEMRERQHEALYVQLATRIDYAGKGTDDSEKPITEDDLESLGLANPSYVNLDLLNSYMSKEDLDEFVKRNGVTRDPGSFSTGEVRFQTVDDTTTIPKGTEVTTELDSDGDALSFFTTKEVTTSSGSTFVDAPVESAERGAEYNVGSGSLVRLPSPPPGVTGDPPVNNPNATTGGENEETNAELRARAKDFLFATSGGGTKEGVEGGLIGRFDGLDEGDVIVDEFPASTPPYADVIIDGGPSDADAKAAIDDLRPVAIDHNLVRPTRKTMNVRADVEGTDIDTSTVNDAITEFLSDLGIGDDLFRDQLIQAVMNADLDVDSIASLEVEVDDEPNVYDSDNSGGDAPNHPLYKLDKGDSMAADGITEVTGTLSGSSHTFVEGTDYDEGTVDGSEVDAIDWGLAGDNPDEDTTFYVDYLIENDMPVASREKVAPGTVTVTVV